MNAVSALERTGIFAWCLWPSPERWPRALGVSRKAQPALAPVWRVSFRSFAGTRLAVLLCHEHDLSPPAGFHQGTSGIWFWIVGGDSGPWSCPQGHLLSDIPPGPPRAHPPGGELGQERQQQSSGGTGGNSLHERHSRQLLPFRRQTALGGERSSLLHCLKAQLKNQKGNSYKALKRKY